MSEMMQQEPEHITDPAVRAIEQAAAEQDVEKLSQLIDEAEALSPESPVYEALEATNYRFALRDVVVKASDAFTPVVSAKPSIPDPSNVLGLTEEMARGVVQQSQAFDAAARGYLDGVHQDLIGAKENDDDSAFSALRTAFSDESLREVVFDRLANLKGVNKNSYLEAGRMISGDITEELWEALQAGREATGALERGERDEVTTKLVAMWRTELDEALERTPQNIQKALKWLEKNEE